MSSLEIKDHTIIFSDKPELKGLRVSSHLDKSSWPRGEWDHEPDELQWIDQATGLDCLMARGAFGAWNGYVAVPEGHPYFGVDWEVPDVRVHGGVTWCNRSGDPADTSERRAPLTQAHPVGWWIGFDCGHAFDLQPAFPDPLRSLMNGTYRNFNYALHEVEGLAEQLAAFPVQLCIG